MGNLYIPLKAFIENLGYEVVLGSKPNKKTLEIGTRYAPESVCLPFKVTLGDMFGALDNGVDTLAFIGGGEWSCRYGYYGRVQCGILERLGYKFRKIFVSQENVKSLITEILKLHNNNWAITIQHFLRAFTLGWH